MRPYVLHTTVLEILALLAGLKHRLSSIDTIRHPECTFDDHHSSEEDIPSNSHPYTQSVISWKL